MIICVYNHGTLEFTVTVQNRCVYVQRDPCRFHTRAAVTCQTLSTNTEASLHYAHSHCKIFQPNNIDDMPRYPKTPQSVDSMSQFEVVFSYIYIWYMVIVKNKPDNRFFRVERHSSLVSKPIKAQIFIVYHIHYWFSLYFITLLWTRSHHRWFVDILFLWVSLYFFSEYLLKQCVDSNYYFFFK